MYTGRPIWTWPCNGGDAQKWVQYESEWIDASTGARLDIYRSVLDRTQGWSLQFNSTDAYPPLVLAEPAEDAGSYDPFFQQYLGS